MKGVSLKITISLTIIICVLVALLAISYGDLNELSATRVELDALQVKYRELETTHAATMKEYEAMRSEYKKLKAKHAGTLSELDNFKADLEKAQSDLEKAQSDLEKAQADLARTNTEAEYLRKQVLEPEFSLHSCEVIDNYGFPSLAISFDASSNVSLHLYDPSGNETDTLNVDKYTKKTKLHLTDYWNTAPAGNYTLTVTNQIGDIVFERKLPFKGAALSMVKYTSRLNVGVLIMHVKNDGDLPIYLSDGEIRVDGKKVALSFGIVGISPDQEKTIIGYTLIFKKQKPRVRTIALKDFSGNVVLTHP